MANNPLTDAALAELDRLHAETGTSCDKWLKACIATFNAYQPMRQRLLDAESRLAEAERERDQLRALADTARDGMRQLGEDLEASRAEVEDIRQQRDYWQEEAVEMRRYKEASESLVAGLREALEEAWKALRELMSWAGCAIEDADGSERYKHASAALKAIRAANGER